MGDDPFSHAKERARAIWSLGDYAALAAKIESAALALVDACAVSAGQEVLDVAAGNGNFALAAAREGAAVVASDITPQMVELGRARSEAEGLEIEWLEADAEELPFEDGRFDCAASVFGAMFAPRPETAARELFRVVRAGGAVGMASWTPEGFSGQQFAMTAKYVPSPEGVQPPTEWGREDVVRERFDGLAASIEFERRTVRWEYETPEEFRRFFEENAGPAIAAKSFLPAEQYEQVSDGLLELVSRFNQADDGSVAIESEYLLAAARKAG